MVATLRAVAEQGGAIGATTSGGTSLGGFIFGHKCFSMLSPWRTGMQVTQRDSTICNSQPRKYDFILGVGHFNRRHLGSRERPGN